jgi:hypothetical protein
MGILFGLFRVFTFLNLFIIGLLMLLVLISALTNPNTTVLLSLVLLALPFFHNYYTMRIQEGLKYGNPINPSFPFRLNALSIGAFMYAGMILITAYTLSKVNVGDYRELLAGSRSNGEFPDKVIEMGKSLSIIMVVTHGALIAINCILSSYFLKKWQAKEPQS